MPKDSNALKVVDNLSVDYNSKYAFAEISGNSDSLFRFARICLWLSVKGCDGDSKITYAHEQFDEFGGTDKGSTEIVITNSETV